MATIAIGGASGLIGTALVQHLRARGDQVLRLVRKAAVQPDEVGWDPSRGDLHFSACSTVDTFVNLSGASIGRRWTDSYKRELLASRVEPTRTLARAAASLGPRATLISASAVGYYGDRGTEPLTEQSAGGTGFMAELVRQWEDATRPAAEAGNRVAIFRTGLVMAPRAGALGPMWPLLRLGVGGPLGPGSQIWPWISLVDEVRAITWLIDNPISGPVNLAAPATNSHAEVVRAVAAALHRPAMLGVPTWAIRTAMGQTTDLITASQNQVPAALLESGFTFDHPTLDDLTEWLARQENQA